MRTGDDGELLFSATDLANFSACERLTALDREAALGRVERPTRDMPMADLLSERGDAHERAYLEKQRTAGLQIVEIPIGAQDADALRFAERLTLDAMRSGADVVYQATFFDGRWGGRADFLRRVEEPSDLGPWSYDIVDTKLARSLKPEAVLQMCEYALQVARLQGSPPGHIHVVLGTGLEESMRLDEVAAYHRRLRDRFAAAVDSRVDAPYPIPVHHCQICRWQHSCDAMRRFDDHLSLVARMRRDQIEKLNGAGVRTVTELAALAPGTPIPKLAPLTFDRLQAQAALQVRSRDVGELLHELMPFEPQRGLHLLPEPSPHDVFFDIEGDPLFEGGGLEYLLGAVTIDSGQAEFHTWNAHDRDAEKRSFCEFIDFVMARYDADPTMHVYHYADYEKAAMKRLMARYGVRELEVDRLLRGEVFVDLYAVVRGALRLGAESYSLKTVEHLYLPPRDDVVKDATSSIVEYERWRATGDDSILADIAQYNQVDCESTWKLRDWLEERRTELLTQGVLIPRPGEGNGEASEQAQQTATRNAERFDALLRTGAREGDSQWLLAHMIDWHQREDRPRWWEHFHRLSLSEEELIDDTTALAGLEYLGVVGETGRSTLHALAFSPGQEHKLIPEKPVIDAMTQERVGEVVSVDDRNGRIVIKRQPPLAEPPRALIPSSQFGSGVLRDAIGRMVDWAIEHGIDARGGPYDAGLALLQGRPSGAQLRQNGEGVLIAAQRVALELDGDVLPIQGPPGAGKTYVGARVVIDLVRAGQRVAITGPSHRAIRNLVAEVAVAARAAGQRVRIMQKTDSEDHVDDMVQLVTGNGDVDAALADNAVDVVAGTAWLFARTAMEGVFSTIVIDEAGQVPLANALAVCGCARSMLLLGDPQQLPQPAVGSHPYGASPSALEHVLGEHATMPEDRGLFLDITWRMHPDITRVVSELSYEGRLQSEPGCAIQAVSGDDALGGSGPRFLPVEHYGNRVASSEEADAVAALVEDLCARTWRDRSGEWRPITLDDIVIVTPFNAHGARLSGVLPEGVRIGSVDRFQGQEAAVAIFSMGTSSADDAPRGLEFVFNLNRLNVAISRGRALSIVVAAPRLLDAHCRTAGQVKLVSALCRYAELAIPISIGVPVN